MVTLRAKKGNSQGDPFRGVLLCCSLHITKLRMLLMLFLVVTAVLHLFVVAEVLHIFAVAEVLHVFSVAGVLHLFVVAEVLLLFAVAEVLHLFAVAEVLLLICCGPWPVHSAVDSRNGGGLCSPLRRRNVLCHLSPLPFYNHARGNNSRE